MIHFAAIRVFPRRTKLTPDDPLAFVGDPPLYGRPADRNIPVYVSCTFSWDKPTAHRLRESWSRFYDRVEIGGPAFDSPGGVFVPGMFLKKGAVITSRGCTRKCGFCLVPLREGRNIRHLPIMYGNIVLDNNILACSDIHILQVFNMLAKQPSPAVFSGGLDSRLLKPWHVELLRSIRVKSMFFACDSPLALEPLRCAGELLSDFSIEKKRCYVLIGFNGENPTEAETRLKAVYRAGFLPFAMLYRGPDAMTRNTREFHDLVGLWRMPGAYKKLMRAEDGQI